MKTPDTFYLLKSIEFKDGNFMKSSKEEVNTYHPNKVVYHSWIKDITNLFRSSLITWKRKCCLPFFDVLTVL